MEHTLESVYKKLYASFGPQHWWPAQTRFEVMVGAILTQNTNWLNVEKAIGNIKKDNLLDPHRLYRIPRRKLASLIRPSGYYNIKVLRLREFLKFLIGSYGASLKEMSLADTLTLRGQLLGVKGIGPETADSMLLYALDKPVFVVDAYTKRILARHSFIKEDASYDAIQNLFMKRLKNEVKLFNEYHALLVRLGKEFCLKNKPKCGVCPLSYVKNKSRFA